MRPQRHGRGSRHRTVLPILLVAISTLLIVPGNALAGETDTFRLQPHPLEVQGAERRSFEVSPEPGGAITDAVLLTNKTDEVRSFRVYAADVKLTEQGGAEIPPAHAEPKGVASWVTLERSEVGLLPGSEEVIRFSLSRPEDEPASGTAAIVAEEVPRDPGRAGIEVNYRIAILIEVTGDAAWLRISEPELDLPIAFLPSGGIARATLTNETMETVDADIAWEVESLTGRIWQLEDATVQLDPGEVRTIETPWPTVPRWGGAYRVSVDATWAAGTVTGRSARTLHPPPWLLALGILAVGARGLREMRARREERQHAPAVPAQDPDALRGRLIEAALWLHAAGRDAPSELREAAGTEARAIASEAGRLTDARDIEQAARSLATFARSLESNDASTRQAAHDFDAWFREHREDPRVKELVGA